MLSGEKVTLRAVRRGDLPRLLDFYNDVEVELAGGGDPPRPTTLERDYAFRLRNLRRVWLEVHASNERAIRAYSSCGFVEEGRMREHIWLDGRYLDNVLMGILRDEWRR